MPPRLRATTLKEEGNALFIAKKYAAALAKYSAALDLDAQSAVLHANRAACYLALCDWDKAEEDASKSVELDEQYSKGWARLAAAQQARDGQLHLQVASFQRALDTLPAQGLAAAQLQQKKQYEDALKKVKAIVAERDKRAAQLRQPAGGMPWEAALRMRPQLQRAGEKGRNSIAWSIIAAHGEFSKGVDALMTQKEPRSQQLLFKWTSDAMHRLTDALLLDPRTPCMIVDVQWDTLKLDISEFFMQTAKHLHFAYFFAQMTPAEGPNDSESGEQLIAQAIRLGESLGKESAQVSMVNLLRAMMLRAWTFGALGKNPALAERLQSAVLDTLKWMADAWKDVTNPFHARFTRAVQHLHLDYYSHAFQKQEKDGPYSNEHRRALAQELLDSCPVAPFDDPSNKDELPYVVVSYDVHPRAYTLYVLAQCQEWEAHEAWLSQDWAGVVDHKRQAVQLYLQQVDTAPEDEETRCDALCHAIEHLLELVTPPPLRETLPLIARLRVATRKKEALWTTSSLQRRGLDKRTDRLLAFDEKMQTAIKDKYLTLDSCINTNEQATPDLSELNLANLHL